MSNKKRILVAKFGGSNGRICFGKIVKDGSLHESRDITSGCNEAKTIIDILDKSEKFDISILTKMLDGDFIPDKYDLYNILEVGAGDVDVFFAEKQFDYMFVINGTINSFGGVEWTALPDIYLYHMLQRFPGKIFFCQCDLSIKLMCDPLYKFARKTWASNYSKDYCDLSSKEITMVTQANNLDACFKNVDGKINSYHFKRDNMRHFSFEKYPVIMPFAHVSRNDNPIYDLGYGGTIRQGRRIDKIAKYYFGYPDDISVYLYGKLDDPKVIEAGRELYGQDVKTPEFGSTCRFVDNGKILNQALATVVIGDKIFESTQTVQQRAWQAMCANVVTFIDEALDTKKTFFGYDDVLKRFMYVSNRDDVVKRIYALKSRPALRDYILAKQQEMLNFDVKSWANELASIITGDNA